MRKKIDVTPQEFEELQKLADIVNNDANPIGQRRIAKAQYETILRIAHIRPSASSRG